MNRGVAVGIILLSSVSTVGNFVLAAALLQTYDYSLKWQSLVAEQDTALAAQDEAVQRSTAVLERCMEMYIQAK